MKCHPFNTIVAIMNSQQLWFPVLVHTRPALSPVKEGEELTEKGLVCTTEP